MDKAEILELDAQWTKEQNDTWRAVVDAACKEAGHPIPKWIWIDDATGWGADTFRVPDDVWLRAVNLGRMAVGADLLSADEYSA